MSTNDPVTTFLSYKTPSEQYEELISDLRKAKVPWKKITAYLVKHSPDWPMGKDGKPLGYQKVLKQFPGYQPAHLLNAFNAYRFALYVGYGRKRKVK